MIRFLSSDRCRTLHSLIDKLIQSNVINSKTALLDARGNFGDLATRYREYEWIQFDHNQTLEDLWIELNPHAKEWWDLLDISEKQSPELPELPGLEDISRLIFICQKLTTIDQDEEMVVVLPHPNHAVQLLGMAQQGPLLIENLLEPLLNWWDNTRKSLSAVETFLRIKLPTSQQLRLTSQWRQNFETLQALTNDRNIHRFYLVLDGDHQNQCSLNRRISVCGMHAVTPSALILSDLDIEVMAQLDEELDASMMTTTSIDNLNEITLDRLEISTKANLVFNASQQSISVFLPGVSKKDLVIKQIGETVFLFYLGQKRALHLTDSLKALTCQKGQMHLGWLTLSFN